MATLDNGVFELLKTMYAQIQVWNDLCSTLYLACVDCAFMFVLCACSAYLGVEDEY